MHSARELFFRLSEKGLSGKGVLGLGQLAREMIGRTRNPPEYKVTRRPGGEQAQGNVCHTVRDWRHGFLPGQETA